MATIDGEYMGMGLRIDDLDVENVAYFKHCADHDFHLQACNQCNRLRYPPTTACPWCMTRESTWKKVEGKGAVHSYTEVHHAIQPAFRGKTPYMVLAGRSRYTQRKERADPARGTARHRQISAPRTASSRRPT